MIATANRLKPRTLPIKYLLVVYLATNFVFSVSSAEIHGAADAIRAVLDDEPTMDQISNVHPLNSKAHYMEQWKIWMVEFFENDHRIAFATLNHEGEVLERGPQSNDRELEDIRYEKLRNELDIARQTGNQAEVNELLELIKKIKNNKQLFPVPLNPEAVLKSMQVIGGYEMNIFRWPPIESHNNVRIQIERMDQSKWKIMDAVSLNEGRWIDKEVQPGEQTSYRVSWLENNSEAKSPLEMSATPRSMSDSELPIYHLQVPEEGLQRMLADVTEDIEIRGNLILDNLAWPIKIRLRGASTRFATKKSYRVKFTRGSPFPRDVIYLKAEPMDHTMQQEKLSSDIFHSNNAPCFKAEYVNLLLNNQYQGVYLDVEPLRVPFKHKPEFNPAGTLIRASTFGWWQQEPLGKLRGKGDGIGRLESFLSEARTVTNASFETWLRRHMNWIAVRDYLALQTLCHRSEIEADDYFFYQDPITERWSLIPWDHNNGNFAVQAFGNRIRKPVISIFPQTIQDIGWEAEYSYMLHSRIFNNQVLRHDYLKRLKELTKYWLIDGNIDALIDNNFQKIRESYPLDPFRTPFKENDPFLDSPKELKRFSKHHGERLMELIEDATQHHPQLSIDFVSRNENSTTIRISNHDRRPMEITNFNFIFKSHGIVRFIQIQHPSMLSPNQSTDLKVTNIPKKEGLLCLIKQNKKEHDDIQKVPISFCFLPNEE